MKSTAVVTFLLLSSIVLFGQQGTTSKQDARQKQAKISMDQAEKTALEKVPGKIKEKELEKEKGKLVYSFDIQTSAGIREVLVDAITGQIVSDKSESAADEAKEQRKDNKKPVQPHS